jgi:hypothetical protein
VLLAAVLLPAAAHAAAADQADCSLLALFDGPSAQIKGSGRVVEDVRDVAGFNRLVVQAPIDVRLQMADTDRVVVHADDNIAPLIETILQGGALVIGLRPDTSYRTQTRVRVKVQAREMLGVLMRGSGELRTDRIVTDVFEATVQGAGDIRIDSVQANAVAVSIAGSGDFRAAGTATSFGVVIDGAGDVYCDKLQAQQVAVRIRGSGDARVHAGAELKVDIDGSGDVRYRGAPKITKSISGSGSVEPL